MNTPFKFVAALALTGLCYGASAQDTKPAADAKMETKTKTHAAKGSKKAAKASKKDKMTKETKM